MRSLASRFRRLDDALADLPVEEPMLLTELDGFLTGVIVSTESIAPGEWLTSVWGVDDGGTPAFDDPLDVQWFADAVMARHDEIVRHLSRGKLKPIFDIDERSGDVLWELWIDGFAEAMSLRPDGWTAVADGKAGDASARLSTLIDIAREESTLDSPAINALHERAPVDIVVDVQTIYASRGRPVAASPGPLPGKVGRNDPCPCGSGRKSKRCCG